MLAVGIGVNIAIKIFGEKSKLTRMIATEWHWAFNVGIIVYILQGLFKSVNHQVLLNRLRLFSINDKTLIELNTFVFEIFIITLSFYVLNRMISIFQLYLNAEHPEYKNFYREPFIFIKIIVKSVYVLSLFWWVSQFHTFYKLSTLFLSTGAFGSAFVLVATRKTAANLLGGIKLMVTGIFRVDEIITLKEKDVIGTVKKITWEYTELETLDGVDVFLNNNLFLTSTVINQSRRSHWVSETNYSIRHIDRGAVDDIIAAIQASVVNDEEVESINIYISDIKSYAIDVNVHVVLKNLLWQEKLDYERKLMHKIMAIIHSHGARLALPTTITAKVSQPMSLEQEIVGEKKKTAKNIKRNNEG